VTELLTVCEIFSRKELENHYFRPLYCDCRPLVEEGSKVKNINVIYRSWKVHCTFSGLQFCRWQYGSIFIRAAVVASQFCEITRNSEMETYPQTANTRGI